MKDDLGFTLVNFSHLIHSGDRISDEPFVFAGQAQQVIFVQDPEDHEWFVPRPCFWEVEHWDYVKYVFLKIYFLVILNFEAIAFGMSYRSPSRLTHVEITLPIKYSQVGHLK
ncbi:hypothetical protein KY289_016215 [Solanum tuberosum]|nr:hypothetical protein KY289_016215 [Solanum tuberosum]